MPHKKKLRHSRVKKKVMYKKLTAKRRSQVRTFHAYNHSKSFHRFVQVPDVKRELNKYAGETRGIKANLVRSVKLKA